MKIRRKTNQCFNCGYTLDRVYNYCPNCGQENNDNNVSFGALINDFFSTYFALDSTFGRSIKPFFFKPGYLTNRYIEGKRASYAHPLRLYLIVSLFYFFVFTMVSKKAVQDSSDAVIQSGYSINDVDGLDKVTRKKLKELISEESLAQVKKGLGGEDLKDLQKAINDNLSEEDIETLKSGMTPQQLALLGIFVPDSLLTLSTVKASVNTTDATATENKKNKEDNIIFDRIDWALLNSLKDNRAYSDQQILDSMKLKNVTSFEEHVAIQSIRIFRADKEQIVEYILKNLPLMMLILIPIFALIIKLLYIRKKKELYIQHLIHGLHLHSFAYLTYGITLLVMTYFVDGEDTQAIIGFTGFIIVSTYAYFSFLRVYRQHWFKTFIKFSIIGYVYVLCISIFFVCEMLLSMLLY